MRVQTARLAPTIVRLALQAAQILWQATESCSIHQWSGPVVASLAFGNGYLGNRG